MKTKFKTPYSSKSAAVRGVARFGANPKDVTYESLDGGRIQVWIEQAVHAKLDSDTDAGAGIDVQGTVDLISTPEADVTTAPVDPLPEVAEVPKQAEDKPAKHGPVSVFKEIFAAHFGTLPRKEILDKAEAAGVSRNTAATYYQKMAKK